MFVSWIYSRSFAAGSGQCCLLGIFEIIFFMYASARSAVDGSGIVPSSVTRTLVEMVPIRKRSRPN